MIDTKITLAPEERRQFVAVLGTLERFYEEQIVSGPPEGAIAGLEALLKFACPHNPELHTLRDDRVGWIVTCHECEASWRHFDH